MIIKEKILKLIDDYKKAFTAQHWEEERYKWQAVKHYQDIKGSDFNNFSDRFLAATEKHFNLLSTSSYWHPRAMIGNFCEICGDEGVAEQFDMLYDESKDLKTRIQNFMDYFASEERIGEVNKKLSKTLKTNQDPRSISVYLASEFPDKYYFYMPSIYDKAKELFNYNQPKGFSPVDKMLKYFEFCDEICKYIKQDAELIEMVSNVITDQEYDDKSLHILVQDILFFYMNTAENTRFWKMSEGNLSFEERKILRENQVVCLAFSDNSAKSDDKRTFASQSSDFQGDISGDYFYLCYGNEQVVLLGRFEDDEIIPSETYINRKGWICRRYTLLEKAIVDRKYTGSKKRWAPSYNSTFISVPSTQVSLFEKEILIPFFNRSLENAVKYAGFFPTLDEYTPDISTEQWKMLLNNPNVFDENSSFVINCFYDHGGQATCKELAEVYGHDYYFYNNISTKLAKRIYEETNCPLYKRDNGTDCRWTILFTGKQAEKEQQGVFVWRLRDELKEAISELRRSKRNSYKKSDFLNDVYITSTEYDRLYTILKHKKNIILQGAPGVGKTFAAKRLAYSIMGEKDDNRVQCVQFHQSYSYEDFIEGYRPLEDGGFKLCDGVFKEFCETASENADKEYFFIIDEINRGNMSKIFGELLMLIESDKRGSSHSLNLVYSNEPFFVPENLHIIGMMNTADRSLAMIDYALRRRFSFYSMKPAFESEGFKKHAEQVKCDLFHKVVEAIKNLNETIVDDKSLGKGFEIGHSYFCSDSPESITDEIVKNIIAFEIIPTIEEYWFDNETKLNDERQKLEKIIGDNNGAV